MRKIKILGLAVLIGGFLLTGCGADKAVKENKDSIVISVGTYMTSGGYDPIAGYGQWGPDVFHSTILKNNENNQQENDLATKYIISDDNLSYEFQLRRDAKFSDGEKLTANDVKFTFDKARESGSTVDLTMLESVTVKDDYTVVFKLKKPWSIFMDTLTAVGIVPAHAYKAGYANKPLGSGPWKVAEFQKEQQLILVPNEYYYGTKPKLKKVTILKLDEEAALAAAKSGKIDIVYVNSDFAKTEVKGMHIEAIDTVSGFAINLPTIPESINEKGQIVGNNVTSDVAIRKALTIGIDRQAIVKNALNGFAKPAYNLSSALPWASKFDTSDNRIDEAKSVLEQAGWRDTDGDGIVEKNGLKAELIMTGRANDLQRYNTVVAVAQEAKKLGINIIVKAAPWSEARVARNIPTCWDLGYFNPLVIYQNFYSKNIGVSIIGNSASYTNPKVDEYIEKALAASSVSIANDFWKKSQWDGEIGTKADYPYLWLAHPQNTYFIKDGLNIGKQKINVRGQGMSIIYNMNEWQW